MTIRKGNRKEKEHGVKAFHVDWPAATGKWHESYCKGWMVTCSSRHTQIHTHAIRPWQRPCLSRPEKKIPWLIGLKSHINPYSTFQPLNTTLHHTHTRAHTHRLRGDCPVTSPWWHTDLFGHHEISPPPLSQTHTATPLHCHIQSSIKSYKALCAIVRSTFNVAQRNTGVDKQSSLQY